MSKSKVCDFVTLRPGDAICSVKYDDNAEWTTYVYNSRGQKMNVHDFTVLSSKIVLNRYWEMQLSYGNASYEVCHFYLGPETKIRVYPRKYENFLDYNMTLAGEPIRVRDYDI